MTAVSSTYFRRILEILEEVGVSSEDALASVGLTGELNWSPKYRFPASIAAGVLSFAKEVKDDPLIGLRCGRKFRIPKLTKYGNIMALCNDIEHAAATNARYAPLVHTIGLPTGIIEDAATGRPKIAWIPDTPPDQFEDFRQIHEYVMTNYVTSLDWLAWHAGKGVDILRLMHDPLAPSNVYEDILGCKVEFNAGEYSVILSDGIAEETLPMTDPEKFAILRAHQERILASLTQRDDLIYKMEHAIRESIRTERPTQAAIAKMLGHSERTLRRLLADQGTTFKAVTEMVKKDLADILIDQGKPLIEVGNVLWYNDQSAFNRAYKRWHGVSPSKRKKIRV